MKLAAPTVGTSFYESVSDLMFAAMAIIVMLMVVFMVQVNLDTGLEELQKRIAERQAVLDESTQEMEAAESELKKLENSRAAFENYQLEIVIAVDTTGSMQLELDLLTDAIALIAKALPQIASSLKMGVVAYRRDERDRLDIKRFPLQTIKDGDEDQRRSYRKVHGFVSALKAQAGSAPVEQAMDEALKMFSDAESFAGHQTFMLLGDVGPYEDRYRDQTISAANRRQEQAMISQLKAWTEKSLNRNALILFSGDDEIAKTGGAQHRKFLESRTFFQALAAGTGQEEAYTNNSSEMIPILIKSALK